MAKVSSFKEGSKKAGQVLKSAGFQRGKAIALEKVDIVSQLAKHGAFIDNQDNVN